MKLTKISAAVLTVCLGSTVAMAAQDVYTKGVEVTATRVTRDLMDVPMSVGVVGEQEIAKKGTALVGRLVEDVPGVQLTTNGMPGQQYVKIRGEDVDRTVILIDGQRLFEQKSMIGTPILVDPSSIERIEVIKGPASVLYGSDAIGGVINIITKKGGDKPLQGSIGLSYDGSGDGFTQNASIYGSYNGWKYRLSGSNSDYKDFNAPDGVTMRGDSDFDTHSLSGFLSYDFTEDLTMGVTADWYKGNYNTPFPVGDEDTYNDFFVKIKPWERKKLGFFADAKNLNDYWARLRFDVYVQDTSKKMQNFISPNMSPAPMVMTVNNFTDNTNQNIGVSVQTEWQLGENNYLIAGTGIQTDDLDGSTNTYQNMTIMGRPYSNSASFTDIEASQNTFYAFLSNETILPADLTATYGVRFTSVKTSLDKYDIIGDEGYPTGSDTSSNTSFNFGLVWRGIEDLAVRANWGQGFRVANAEDKYYLTTMGGGTIEPNPDLDPETSNNFELGARYTGDKLDLDVAAFLSLADDYINTKTIGDMRYRYENVGKATTYGIELTASYELPYNITPYASMTWMRRQFDYGGILGETYDTGTPDFTYRAGVRYEHDFGLWTFTADTYARGATDRDEESESEGVITKTHHAGYTTANIELGALFGDKRQYSVTAAVLNIFDKEYYVNDSLPEAGVHAVVTANARF